MAVHYRTVPCLVSGGEGGYPNECLAPYERLSGSTKGMHSVIPPPSKVRYGTVMHGHHSRDPSKVLLHTTGPKHVNRIQH